MDVPSLFRQAEKYRLLARGVNDAQTLVVLEEMARELEAQARKLQSLQRLVETARKYAATLAR